MKLNDHGITYALDVIRNQIAQVELSLDDIAWQLLGEESGITKEQRTIFAGSKLNAVSNSLEIITSFVRQLQDHTQGVLKDHVEVTFKRPPRRDT